MIRLLLCFILIINFSCGFCYSSESKYSNGISRLEREWLHREFPNEDDEVRISRLEAKVFGTIHEKDLKSRYIQLREAFDAKKQMQTSHNNNDIYRGIPTSIPISVQDLIRGY